MTNLPKFGLQFHTLIPQTFTKMKRISLVFVLVLILANITEAQQSINPEIFNMKADSIIRLELRRFLTSSPVFDRAYTNLSNGQSPRRKQQLKDRFLTLKETIVLRFVGDTEFYNSNFKKIAYQSFENLTRGTYSHRNNIYDINPNRHFHDSLSYFIHSEMHNYSTLFVSIQNLLSFANDLSTNAEYNNIIGATFSSSFGFEGNSSSHFSVLTGRFTNSISTIIADINADLGNLTPEHLKFIANLIVQYESGAINESDSVIHFLDGISIMHHKSSQLSIGEN